MRRSLLTLGAAFLALGVSNVKADTITLAGSNSGPVFTYTASLSGFGKLVAGDFFTIFDFGPTSSVSTPTDWTVLSQGAGTGVAGTSESSSSNTVSQYDLDTLDNSGLTNYTFVYTGTTIPTDTSTFNAVGLGDFVLTSSDYTGQLAVDDYASRDHSRVTGNIQNFHTENVVVPAVPAPAAVWGGLGLLGVLAAAGVRKARRA